VTTRRFPAPWSVRGEALGVAYRQRSQGISNLQIDGRFVADAHFWTMSDVLYFCPTCKTIYEIVRHHIRPLAEPVCERCQQDLPVAEDGEWLTYRRTRPRFARTE